MKSFKGQRVVITGAGSGLGRELSLCLAQEGARLYLSDVKLEGLEETVRMLKNNGAQNVYWMKCDVQLKSEIEALREKVEQQFVELDLLINNAGVAGGGNFEKIPQEDWQWCFNVNYWSVVWSMQSFLPLLNRSKKSPHILNIASAAGLLCGPQMAAYNCSKAAVIALSRSAHLEFGQKGIGVSIACPTFFETNIINNARICDAEMLAFANFWAKHSSVSARTVALRCLKGIKGKKLYILPSWDAKLLWFLNRLFPEIFARIGRSILVARNPPS